MTLSLSLQNVKATVINCSYLSVNLSSKSIMFPLEMSRSRSWWNRTLPLTAQTTVCGLSRIAVKVEIKSNFGGEWFDPRTPSSPCTTAKFHLTEHHSRNLTHLCLADAYKLNQVLAIHTYRLSNPN